MTYTAQQIANYFLEKSKEEDRPITQLKLMKLIYIAYGWNFALYNEKLFYEPIEAWKHGPVIPSIYHEFKHFGRNPISGQAVDISFDFEDDKDIPLLYAPEIDYADQKTKFVLDKVWIAYRGFTGSQLRNKTHEDGSPWHKVFDKNKRGVELIDDDIKEHYTHRIRKYLDAA